MKKTGCSSVRVLIGVIVCLLLVGQAARADLVFGEPKSLGPLVNAQGAMGASADYDCHIASDGLSLIFTSQRPPGGGWSTKLWMTSRATEHDEWSPAEYLGDTVNVEKIQKSPWLSADGLELYYAQGTERQEDIVVSKRNTLAEPWGVPENLGDMINSAATDSGPSLTADGLELYFDSSRTGKQELYVSTRATISDPWEQATSLGPIVNSTYGDDLWGDGGPCIASDGLTLLFNSARPPGDTYEQNIWMTRRSTRESEWEPPVLLTLPGYNIHGDFSPSMRAGTLYFGSSRSGPFNWDLWQVQVLPVVDFNEDGNVEPMDVAMLVENWGTGNSLYDIGPTLFGDGIVDAKDLRAIADYMIINAEAPLPSIDAQSITATASSSDSENTGPEKTIDGSGLNAQGQHSTLNTDMWLSGGTEPQWIQYEFDGVYELHEMHVWNSNQLIEPFLGLGAKDVLIETSMDGIEWTALEGTTQFNQATGGADYTANTIVDFGGVSARFVRINILSGYGTWSQWGLSEIRFY